MLSQYPTIGLAISLMAAMSLGWSQSNAAPTPPTQSAPTYVLGPGDQLTVQLTPGGEEVNGKQWRIDGAGDLVVPMAGTVHATGLTPSALAGVLTEKYQKYFRAPQVIV